MLYHFQIELSDIDQGIYETLNFRIYQHPSEIGAYLLTRALAFALSFTSSLEFSPEGLSDPDAPALKSLGIHGVIEQWIEIGNPSPKKLHKASKTARDVIVYTYKNPDILIDEIKKNKVHRADEIQIFSLDINFLNQLESRLKSNNKWSLLIQNARLDVGFGDTIISTDIKKFTVSN